MLYAILFLAGLAVIGVGLAVYAERNRRKARPPAGMDIPSRDELAPLLQACIGAKIAGVATDAGVRFLAGAAYWKARAYGLPEKECLENAALSLEADLEIRIV